MKFVEMRLNNWRSFYGTQSLVFSTDPERPVTLILGSNGAGKTALLNAFTWVIYGDFTEGFDRRQDLINHEALKIDPDAEATVELVVVDDGKQYKIRRTVNATQQTNNANDVFVSVDGMTQIEEAVHQLLPRALKDLFFFPAETFGTAQVLKTKHSQAQSASLAIDNAIRTLLAGDVYHNAVGDLRAAVNNTSLKTNKGVGDNALAAASADYEMALAVLNEAEQQNEKLPGQLAHAQAEAEKAARIASLYDGDKIKAFNQDLERKTKAVATAKTELALANSLYVKAARLAHTHFSQKAIQSAIHRLDTAEQCGLIPPRIDGNVLDLSLKNGICALCGDQLSDTGTHRVEMLRERVADSMTALRGLETRSLLKEHVKNSAKAMAELHEEVTAFCERFENVSSPAPNADLPHLRATVHECISLADHLVKKSEMELEDFKSAQATDQPVGNVVEAAVARQLAVQELESSLATMADRLSTLRSSRDAKLAIYTAKSKGSQDSSNKIAAIKLLEEAKNFFEAALEGLSDFGRIDFERAINVVYADLVRKDYELRVDRNFRIELFVKGTDQLVAASQAENVLLLIAFLGAIARLAPKYQQIAKDRAQFTQVGHVETSAEEGFSVVIDAPTSALDDEYENAVVNALPKLLPQIIIPVSAKSVTKWQAISDRIGQVFVMELTSNAQNDRTVRWNGKDHVYSRNDESVMSRTKIVKID